MTADHIRVAEQLSQQLQEAEAAYAEWEKDRQRRFLLSAQLDHPLRFVPKQWDYHDRAGPIGQRRARARAAQRLNKGLSIMEGGHGEED